MRPRYAGISAQMPPEYAPASFRNLCPDASGITAQVRPEYALDVTLSIVGGGLKGGTVAVGGLVAAKAGAKLAAKLIPGIGLAWTAYDVAVAALNYSRRMETCNGNKAMDEMDNFASTSCTEARKCTGSL